VSALLVKTSLAERVQEADYIVTGTVTAQESHWDQPRALIYTDVTIRVEETLKAPATEAPPSELVARIPGGRVGTLVMQVSDIPTFQLLERAVVFLRQSQTAGLCHVVAGTAGTFRLVTDPVSHQEVVVNEAGEFLVDLKAQRFERQPAPEAKVTAAQLKQHLYELIRQ
jgi:hypothetical protein